MHLLEKLVPEHVGQGQLSHLDKEIIYAPILLPLYGQSYQIELEKYINWLLVLILDYINRSDKGAYFI